MKVIVRKVIMPILIGLLWPQAWLLHHLDSFSGGEDEPQTNAAALREKIREALDEVWRRFKFDPRLKKRAVAILMKHLFINP